MSFEIKQATRTGVKMLAGLYGKSGSGKTLSALYLARGLAGPSGKVRLIDSESGRGSLFADIVPGGYEVIEIDPPFSPERYQQAFELAEDGASAVVIDSLTHEHNGEGGVLDMQEAELKRMAGDDYRKREACKMAAWIKPKMEHKKFIQRILRSKVPLICCLRGEEKTHMVKEDGKNNVVTDEFSSPLFDPRFLFELLVNFETIQRDGKGGFVVPRKVTHPDIANLLPRDNQQLSIAHGEALAKWCSSGTAPKAEPVADARKGLIAAIWSAGKSVRGTEKSWDGFEIWALGNKLISDTETIKTLPESRLEEVLRGTKSLLESQPV